MSGRQIEVEIEELVLHGFDPGDRCKIADALQSELTASLADWQPAAARTIAHLDGGSFELAAGAGAAAVGRGVARQVHQGVG
jgi:hypothetical protein